MADESIGDTTAQWARQRLGITSDNLNGAKAWRMPE